MSTESPNGGTGDPAFGIKSVAFVDAQFWFTSESEISSSFNEVHWRRAVEALGQYDQALGRGGVTWSSRRECEWCGTTSLQNCVANFSVSMFLEGIFISWCL